MPMETYKMLKVNDLGCSKHHARELTFSGSEAELVEVIINNLAKEGDLHIFVCDHGHTHIVNVEASLTAQVTP